MLEIEKMQEPATSSIAASSLPSSSERSSSSALNAEGKEGMESDDEIRRVPEIGGATGSGRDGGSAAGSVKPSAGGSRRRGRSPADKENKRLKRSVNYTYANSYPIISCHVNAGSTIVASIAWG